MEAGAGGVSRPRHRSGCRRAAARVHDQAQAGARRRLRIGRESAWATCFRRSRRRRPHPRADPRWLRWSRPPPRWCRRWRGYRSRNGRRRPRCMREPSNCACRARSSSSRTLSRTSRSWKLFALARGWPALRPGPFRSRSRSHERQPKSRSWPSSRRLWATQSCGPTPWWRGSSRRPPPNQRLTSSASTWTMTPTLGVTRRDDSRAKLARGFGRQAFEALQVVLVVVERDPKVAVDGELAELCVHADATPLLLAQPADEIDEPVAGGSPLCEGCLQRDAVEVSLVVAVVLELRASARGHFADARLEALGLRRGQVCRDVAQGPGPDTSRIVIFDQLRHRDHQLLARFELFEQRVAHAAGSGVMRRARGLAASRSATTAARTSSGAPGLSSTGPHAQPSR